MIRIREAWPPARWRRGTTRFAGMCGIDGLTRQTHRDKGSSKILVHSVPLCLEAMQEQAPICISRVTGGSQQLNMLESEMSRTRNEWQKHPIVMAERFLASLAETNYLSKVFQRPKINHWVFSIVALEMEENKKLFYSVCCPHSVVELLKAKGLHMPFNTSTEHQ